MNLSFVSGHFLVRKVYPNLFGLPLNIFLVPKGSFAQLDSLLTIRQPVVVHAEGA